MDPAVRKLIADNAVEAKQAFEERDEVVVRMKELMSILQNTKSNLKTYKEKCDTYELLLLRDDSHIKKLKKLIVNKNRQIVNLQKEKSGEIYDDVETDGVESDVASISKETFSDYGSELSVVYGISTEIYDQLLRDYIQLQKEFDQLREQTNLNPKKYLEDEETKMLIAQLEAVNNELKQQNKKLEKKLEEIIDTIKREPSSDKAKIVDLSQELKSLQEKYGKQELLLHCMENKCHELARELLKLKKSSQGTETKACSKEERKTDTTTNVKSNGALLDSPADQQSKKFEVKNSALETKLKSIQKQNELLIEKLKSAEVKSQISEQRYRELLKTIKENKPEVETKCDKCSSNEKICEELRKKIEEEQQRNGHLNAQLSVYQEDYNHSRQEISNLKKRHDSEIEQWKTNYIKLSDELDKMKKTLKESMQQKRVLSAERYRPLNVQPCRSQNWADHSSNRWLVDTADELQGPSTNTHRQVPETAGIQSTSFECQRCRRQFPPHQEDEFIVHERRCLDD